MIIILEDINEYSDMNSWKFIFNEEYSQRHYILMSKAFYDWAVEKTSSLETFNDKYILSCLKKYFSNYITMKENIPNIPKLIYSEVKSSEGEFSTNNVEDIKHPYIICMENHHDIETLSYINKVHTGKEIPLHHLEYMGANGNKGFVSTIRNQVENKEVNHRLKYLFYDLDGDINKVNTIIEQCIKDLTSNVPSVTRSQIIAEPLNVYSIETYIPLKWYESQIKHQKSNKYKEVKAVYDEDPIKYMKEVNVGSLCKSHKVLNKDKLNDFDEFVCGQRDYSEVFFEWSAGLRKILVGCAINHLNYKFYNKQVMQEINH